MKVKAGSLYYYQPNVFDRFDARTNLQCGDRVRVVNLPGCPKANTMCHCHVEDPVTGKFIGLVMTASLFKEPTAHDWRGIDTGRKCAYCHVQEAF